MSISAADDSHLRRAEMSDLQSRRGRRDNARARTDAGLDPRPTTHLLVADNAPGYPPAACKVVANDPGGAEVCTGLEPTPGTEKRECIRVLEGWLSHPE